MLTKTCLRAGLLVLFGTVLLTASNGFALPDQPVRELPATDIAAACLDTETTVSTEICYAFVLGVMQTHNAATPAQSPRLCLTEGLVQQDLVVAVRRYMRRNMSTLSQPADRIVLAALAAAWPCD